MVELKKRHLDGVPHKATAFANGRRITPIVQVGSGWLLSLGIRGHPTGIADDIDSNSF